MSEIMLAVKSKGDCFEICCCSVAKLCLTLCNSMAAARPVSSVLHCLLEFAQIPVH